MMLHSCMLGSLEVWNTLCIILGNLPHEYARARFLEVENQANREKQSLPSCLKLASPQSPGKWLKMHEWAQPNEPILAQISQINLLAQHKVLPCVIMSSINGCCFKALSFKPLIYFWFNQPFLVAHAGIIIQNTSTVKRKTKTKTN
jgi:hypothetical protein